MLKSLFKRLFCKHHLVYKRKAEKFCCLGGDNFIVYCDKCGAEICETFITNEEQQFRGM